MHVDTSVTTLEQHTWTTPSVYCVWDPAILTVPLSMATSGVPIGVGISTPR